MRRDDADVRAYPVEEGAPTLYKIGDSIAMRGKGIVGGLSRVYVELRELLVGDGEAQGDQLGEELSLIAERIAMVHESSAALEALAERPVMTIAVAGTTSSGKSALINLLCGAQVVPEAVAELSAGVVEIEHGDRVSLTVERTRDARWWTGSRDSLSSDEVREVLREVMERYQRHRFDQTPPESPRVRLIYPTLLGRSLVRREVTGEVTGQRECALRLIDLPGLSHVHDEQSADLIRSRCAHSLNIVTYNAAETDVSKQGALLDQLVRQTRTLNGAPEQMLFVLNRFDVYERDDDPEESRRRAFDRLSRSLREALVRAFPNVDALQTMIPVRLATQPALLVERGDLKTLERRFGYLIPDEVLGQLHRDPDRWSNEERSIVLEVTRGASHLDEFKRALHERVNTHLPALVFAPAVEALKREHLRPALYDLSSTIDALIDQSRGALDAKIITLSHAQGLLASRQSAVTREYLGTLSAEPDAPLTRQLDALHDLLSRHDVMSVELEWALGSLASYVDQLGRCVERELFEPILSCLSSGEALPSAMSYLTSRERAELDARLCALRDAGYTEALAERGDHDHHVTADEPTHQRLLLAFERLGERLSSCISAMLYRHQERAQPSTRRAVSTITRAIAQAVRARVIEPTLSDHDREGSNTQRAAELLSQLGFSFTDDEPDLDELDLEPMEVELSHPFEIRYVIQRERNQVSLQGERRPILSWLSRADRYHKLKMLHETERAYSSASIPSAVDLIDALSSSYADSARPHLKRRERSLRDHLRSAMSSVQVRQRLYLDELCEKLMRTRDELSGESHARVAHLSALKAQLITLEGEISELKI